MIIVFGSNVYDIFFHVTDLPEKDQALFLDTHAQAPGGKGQNQAVAAAIAGASVKFYGAVGQGAHARALLKNLEDRGIDTSGVEQCDHPTGVAAIFVDPDGTHKVVVSKGANLHVSQKTISNDHLDEKTTVILQGELPMGETESLIRRAKEKGARTLMNLAPYHFISEEALQNLDYIILNEYEADALAKQLDMSSFNKEAFAKDLALRFDLACIVTLGGNGSVCSDGKKSMLVSALNIRPIDTIGAGDAYTGYFAAALDMEKSLEDALKWGAVAGSLACTKIGAQEALPLENEVSARVEDIVIRSS